MLWKPKSGSRSAFSSSSACSVYLGVHRMIVEGARRPRQARIKAELDEARKAQGRGGAACSPNSSASGTKPRAKRRTSSPAPRPRPSGWPPKPRQGSKISSRRRTKMAETKIAQAEAQAPPMCAPPRPKPLSPPPKKSSRRNQRQARRRADRQRHRGRPQKAELNAICVPLISALTRLRRRSRFRLRLAAGFFLFLRARRIEADIDHISVRCPPTAAAAGMRFQNRCG